MGELFGTDGIRGAVNTYPMTPELAIEVGRAVALKALERGGERRVVIGKDTRISGDMIESAVAAGICAGGADVLRGGVLPTPGIAYLVVSEGASAGIVISASHNPFHDNGIKIFSEKGSKLSDEDEADIERMILTGAASGRSRSVRETGRVFEIPDAGKRYIDFLLGSQPKDFSLEGFKIVIDCSNGATSGIAPELFRRLGADCETICATPDGRNINAGCGSEFPGLLMERTVASRACLGLAFDGDGDRLIAVDENGSRVSGDQMLAILAAHLKERGLLKNNRIVGTVMSNLGLKIALERLGISYVEADVGDRRVLERMLSNGAVLGGEDSGHLIFLDHHTTGDGLLTALKLLETVRSTGLPLSRLSSVMTVFPQALVNVEVRTKTELGSVPEIGEAIRDAEEKLNGKGRVLVRYSGTQPLCRVMVEAETVAETKLYCGSIASVIERHLGIRSVAL